MVSPDQKIQGNIFQSASYLFNKGYNLQVRDGKILEALKYYSQAIKFERTHYGCAYNLGFCYY